MRKEVEVIRMRAKVSFFFLIKNYILADYDLSVVWSLQFVSIGIVFIAGEDKLLTFAI